MNIICRTPEEFQLAILTIETKVKNAVGTSVPYISREIAETLRLFQVIEFSSLIGTKNVTGRPNKTSHIKVADSLVVINRRIGPTNTIYEIVSKAPHIMWVEYGANAEEGLPWSHPSGKPPRDYTKSKFKGYRAFKTGTERFIRGKFHMEIAKKNILYQLSKIRI